jgi:hypothetical protein
MTTKITRTAVTAALLATACAHTPGPTRAPELDATPVCRRDAMELASVVERVSDRFAVCAGLADPSATEHE